MPVSQLIALVLTLGIVDLKGESGVASDVFATRMCWFAGSLVVFAALVSTVGKLIARQKRSIFDKCDTIDAGRRRMLHWASRALDALSLGLFVWWMLGLEWPRLVAWNLGLGKTFLIDDLATLAPFFLAQLLLWVGLFRAEVFIRGLPRRHTLKRHVWLRARQALGITVPLLLVYGIGRDGMQWLFPQSSDDAIAQMMSLAIVGAFMLLLAPVFVRLSWPTRSLEPGPLRRKLERIADRFGFRCTDILVWETGGSIVNAGITGALPWFRYVLLTDALIAQLDSHEVEAVFGHEIGHVAHRHLAYFGFFFLGSIGVLALMESALRWSGLYAQDWLPTWSAFRPELLFEWGLPIALLGLYFFLVFGFLSRCFERQADVFGCLAVSCGRDVCPPHADLNTSADIGVPPDALCPVGIEVFSNALSDVAALNGLSHDAPSWRHGSIARRVAFLRGLTQRPEAVKRFQVQLIILRVGIAIVLGAATALAFWTSQFNP